MHRTALATILLSVATLVPATQRMPSIRAAVSTLPAVRVASTPSKAGLLGNPMQAVTQVANAASQATVSIAAVNIVGSTVNAISGAVGFSDGTSIPFQLSGDLLKDPRTATVDGSLVDRENNFRVARFQIVMDASTGIFMSTAARTSSDAYIALYLQRIGTRDLTFLEQPAADVLGAATELAIQAQSASFAAAPKEDVLWVEALFIPDSISHQSEAVASPMTPGQASLPTAGPVPLSDVTQTHLDTYTATYSQFGYTATDTMVVQEQTTIPNDTAAQTILGKLSVSSVDFRESNGVDLKATWWEIGGNGPAGVKLTCQNGSAQRVKWEQIAGLLEQSNSWSVAWSFSPSYQMFTLNFSYGGGGQVALGNGANQDTSGAYVADTYTDSGEYLISTSDYISGAWTAPDYTKYGGPQTVTDTVDFIYDMYLYPLGAPASDHPGNHYTMSFQTYAD